MKKSLLTLGLATLALSSFAGERILFQQNFETASDPAAIGWTYGGASMTIASDEYGSFLELSLGQNNGRSGQVTWGQDIFLNKEGESVLEDGIYNMSFDFSLKTMSNNQYNGEITVFTNHQPKANETYRLPWSAGYEGPWDNFLFDLSQCNTSSTDNTDMLAVINAPIVTAEDGTSSIDTSNEKTINVGNWYTVSLVVNVNTREVEYSVVDLSGNGVQSGTMNVPENDKNGDPISMYAEGLFIMTARYNMTFDIDNIKIAFDSEGDWANEPTVALTRVGKTSDDELDLNLRAYTISFLDGETLHIIGTDGSSVEAEYADCDGEYVYETTTSGTLKAWTTSGSATSDAVEITVECTPISLPEVVATISSVETGFGKTYTLSVSNTNTPLQPAIFINYEFTGVKGEKISGEGAASGVKVTVNEEGTLKLTSEAFGYQSTTTSIENNLQFEVKKQWDFARMTDEEIKKAGFPDYNILNSGATSGFNNWTARKRLYYTSSTETVEKVDEEGNVSVVPATIYPFGFISEDNTENVMYYTELDVEGEVATNVAGYELFDGLNVFAGHNVSYLKHVGVYNNATSGGNNKNIDVLDLSATDFVVINKINNYGGNSNHPECATNDEYYAQLTGENEVFRASEGTINEETGKYTVSCPVYRIDTAANCLTVYAQVGVDDAVEVINAVIGDNYWYTIAGVRVTEPTQPGLYIRNGKKYIVK